jgi:hypothetical protein
MIPNRPLPPGVVYWSPEPISDAEVMAAIRNDDVEALRKIPIRLGFHHENWRFIQDVSVRLSSHRDVDVRANSLLGLLYAARFRGRVEKNVVKPILLRALRDSHPHVVYTAQDAIEEINLVMKWDIGGAKRQKAIEARYERRKKG